MKEITLESCRAMGEEELLCEIRRLAASERRAVCALLVALAVLDARGTALRIGYSSLFAFLVEALGYSRSTAGRRVAAARAIRRFPFVLDMLRRGEIGVWGLAALAPHLTESNARAVLARARGRTCEEIERMVAALRPPEVVRERIRVVRKRPPRGRRAEKGGDAITRPIAAAAETAPVVEFRFAATEAFRAKFERARMLLSSAKPRGLSIAEVFEAALDAFLERRDPFARHARRKMRTKGKTGAEGKVMNLPGGRSPPGSEAGGPGAGGGSRERRAIPISVRDAVWVRDGGMCTFVGPDGTRCGSRWDLEVHHIVPHALGGPDTPENLTLRCRAHNAWEAEEVFGPFGGRRAGDGAEGKVRREEGVRENPARGP